MFVHARARFALSDSTYNQALISKIPAAGKRLEEEDNIKLVVFPELLKANECQHRLV